jgi:cysteine synthase
MGMSEAKVKALPTIFDISGVCSVFGAIKTAKFYDFGPRDVIVTICTDPITAPIR